MERTVDVNAIRNAVAEGNIPTLLMVLFHLTGDRRWLREPYLPTRTKGMSENESGGLPAPVQDDVRAAATLAIAEYLEGRPIAVAAPDGDLLVEMLTACMGEEVPPEYGPMMAEILGIAPQPAPSPDRHEADLEVAIIGAGISGLTAALKLKEAGIPFRVFEKNSDVGGTWLENRYPGCGVDTPSYLYSYSFFSREWSTHFAKRDEVAGYLKDMAEHFDLTSSVTFGVEVVAGSYEAARKQWRLTLTDREGHEWDVRANAVVTAVGQLNRPHVPKLTGMDLFDGPLFHSARWPDGLDVRGKRVAVVGSGASAMQIVPAVADRVDQLLVFQRSPQWIAPNENYFRQIGEPVHWLMANVPFYEGWYRARLAWTFNDKVHASLQVDPEWPYPDRAINSTNDAHRRYFTSYLMSELDGREDLVEKSLPTYPPFGKRMLLDNGWYAALRRDNVDLVAEAVTGFTSSGVVTASGAEWPADVVVLATGFEAQQLLYPLDLIGRDGRSLRETWGYDDARAYLGVTVPGFPNLFLMYGPNTNLGHGGSYITIAECQIRYIVDLLLRMGSENVAAVDCRPDVFDEYNRRVDAAHERMVWTHRGMSTWYRNAHGRVVTNLPWRIVDYWRMTHHADLDDYDLETGLSERAHPEPTVSG